MTDDCATRRLCRRRWLIESGWGLVGCMAVLGSTSSGCGGEAAPPDDGRLRIPLQELPLGERVVHRHEEAPIEILRTRDSVRARLLLCTHFGCEVEWSATESVYVCPCHEARFAPDGSVLAGPPSKPLRDLPVERVENLVLIDPGA